MKYYRILSTDDNGGRLVWAIPDDGRIRSKATIRRSVQYIRRKYGKAWLVCFYKWDGRCDDYNCWPVWCDRLPWACAKEARVDKESRSHGTCIHKLLCRGGVLLCKGNVLTTLCLYRGLSMSVFSAQLVLFYIFAYMHICMHTVLKRWCGHSHRHHG